MGCEVERTATGAEVSIHRFDTHEAAARYIVINRDYLPTLSKRNGLYLYTGPVPGEYASVTLDQPGSSVWRANFWIEGDIKVESGNPYEGQPVWHGLYRVDDGWVTVYNAAGNALSYMDRMSAYRGAQWVLDTLKRVRNVA